MIRRTLARFLFPLAIFATLWVVVVLLVHATVQDYDIGWSMVYYLSPWAVIAAVSAALTVYWRRRRIPWLWMPLLVVAAQATGIWVISEWRWPFGATEGGTLRLVQWNADRPDWRLPGDIAWLRSQNADIITIAEDQPKSKRTLEQWRAGFPEYRLVKSPYELLCFVRGEVLEIKRGPVTWGSHASLMRAVIKGEKISLIQTDIIATPTRLRQEPLAILAHFVEAQKDANVIVAGDFNTPRTSPLFNPLRKVAINAFEAAGRGYGASWPMPFPVLSLDHVWSTGRLRPVRCESGYSWRSDHRAMIVDFVIDAGRRAPAAVEVTVK